MRNLFNFATKELTQDAFLRWLFANWEDNDIGPLAFALLKEFCKIQDNEVIKEIKSWAQWAYIDLTFYIDTDKQRYALFIEDKAFSNEHNQLKTYDNKIEKISDRQISKIFYKTSLVKDEERERVEFSSKENNEEETGWKVYDINAIFRLFSQFKNHSNLIVNQYISYICELKEATVWEGKPESNDGGVDFLKWESFFDKMGKDIIKEHGYKKGGVWKAGQFPYMCLVFKYHEFEPYLEVRSRDCISYTKEVKHPFIARILCYEVEGSKMSCEEIKRRQEKIIKKIKEDNIFQVKGLRRGEKGFYRQLGFYTTQNIDTEDKFKDELKKCAEYFDKIILLWNA